MDRSFLVIFSIFLVFIGLLLFSAIGGYLGTTHNHVCNGEFATNHSHVTGVLLDRNSKTTQHKFNLAKSENSEDCETHVLLEK